MTSVSCFSTPSHKATRRDTSLPLCGPLTRRGEREYLEGIAKLFEDQGHEVYWIELEADIETRIQRNQSQNRLAHKPSKRDVAWSERDLIESAEKHRLNSNEGELDYPRYMRINNADKSASDVAKQIWEFMN